MILKTISKSLTDILFSIAGKKDKNNADAFMKLCCMSYERTTGDFCSYRRRPNDIDELIFNDNLPSCADNTAIILQGPIVTDNDFTLNTVKLYLKYYPEVRIIISTWENADAEILKKLQNMGAVIVLNKLPEVSGLGNINYQVVSTCGGIIKAKEMGASYVLKTRADQRIYKPYILDYFMSLMEQYPLEEGKTSTQKKRIVTFQSPVGGGMFIPYFISDFLYFGTVEDISHLFDIELDSSTDMTKDERRDWLRSFLKKNPSILDYYNSTAPEIKIIKNYIIKYLAEDYQDTVEDSWSFVKNYLISLSWDDIELFWPKYDSYNESSRYQIHNKKDRQGLYLRYNWTFSNWLLLYNGRFKYIPELEEYVHQSCDKLNLKI